MKINLPALCSTLSSWSREITQFKATMLITKAYVDLGMAYPTELSRIEYDDGTVDHQALTNNNQNIFHRWRKCNTEDQIKKLTALAPAIIEAMPTYLRDMITNGDSLEFQTARLLKEHTDVLNAILLGSPLPDFEKECAEFEIAYASAKKAYRFKQQRHDH
ncbi:toxin YdaT family protein [Buttiauxella sp. S19-1]|uniref:toxin YdaT family protein n=1 Tax=Buttiauxella sp. S19-1 TaxID=941430 RepID=UPI001EDA10E0|nr:toxin YdaT family protein [Buttiauxella sp. S19-1]